MKRNLLFLISQLTNETKKKTAYDLEQLNAGKYATEKPYILEGQGVRNWAKKTNAEKRAIIRQAHAQRLATRKSEMLNLYENGEDFGEFVARVNWHKSSVWGYNPTAQTWAGYDTYGEGSASGCGYDKLSASICSSLSDRASKNIKTAIIRAFVKHGQPKNETARVLPYGVYISLYAYGGISLSFGGCGESTIRNLFDYCGYSDYRYISGELFDYIEARKPQAKKSK